MTVHILPYFLNLQGDFSPQNSPSLTSYWWVYMGVLRRIFPYVSGYHVPVIRSPFFTLILHPMTPVFLQSTPNDPFFSTCVWSNFTYKLQIFACFACILRNLTILRQYDPTEWPPFFDEILQPYFGSPIGTFKSLSYSSASTPGVLTLGRLCTVVISTDPLLYLSVLFCFDWYVKQALSFINAFCATVALFTSQAI